VAPSAPSAGCAAVTADAAASAPAGPGGGAGGEHRPFRFLLLFVAIFLALQGALLLSAGTRVERFLIDTATVRVAAGAITLVDPGAGVQAVGSRLDSGTARLNVLRGCEGTELYCLWIAAVLAFPATAGARAKALAAGLAAAYLLNEARIVGLFYVVRDARAAFELAHGYIAPTLLVVLLALGFWWWAGRTRTL
jgi:exosortase family protein XrtM